MKSPWQLESESRQAISELERQRESKHLYCVARQGLSALESLAMRNNRAAFKAWLDVLNSSLSMLEALAPCLLSIARPIAERSWEWPGRISVSRDKQKMNEALMKQLHLGANAPLNFKGKQSSIMTPEVLVAWNLYMDISRRRRQPLSRANYKQWWKAAQPLFIAEYGQDFENHQAFARYKSNKAYCGDMALIRRDIKRKVQQAFHSLAPRVINRKAI